MLGQVVGVGNELRIQVDPGDAEARTAADQPAADRPCRAAEVDDLEPAVARLGRQRLCEQARVAIADAVLGADEAGVDHAMAGRTSRSTKRSDALPSATSSQRRPN